MLNTLTASNSFNELESHSCILQLERERKEKEERIRKEAEEATERARKEEEWVRILNIETYFYE